MSHDLRKTALIAGILMAIQPICAVAFGIRDLLGHRSYPWPYIEALTLDTLPLVGLPVLFLPAVSGRG
jgi:hypothetical protein